MSKKNLPHELTQPPHKERVIVYIDGFNLYFGIKSAGLRKHCWLDLQGLSKSILKPHQELLAVKFFTARVAPSPRDPNQHVRQNTYLEALGTCPLLTFHWGHYLAKTITCKQCQATWPKPEEKMTDVNIAVEMLSDAFLDRCDTLLVISGDSDLTGPVTKIKAEAPGKRVVAAFPPKRVSARLKKEMHAHFSIGADKIRQNQLPNPVVKPDGVKLHKPTQWK